jgi:hypothetical protein
MISRYDQNKIDGLGTWPEFKKGMYFYTPAGVILDELEDCSEYSTEIESKGRLHDEREFVSSNNTMSRTRDYTEDLNK